MASKGLTSEKIGEALKHDKVHPKEYGLKISRILKEKNVFVSPDLKNAKNKLERIKAHSEKNKQDKRARREKERIFSKVRKLERYYAKVV